MKPLLGAEFKNNFTIKINFVEKICFGNISVIYSRIYIYYVYIIYMLRSKCINGHYNTVPGQCVQCPISMDNVENYTLCPGIVQNDQSTVGNYN